MIRKFAIVWLVCLVFSGCEKTGDCLKSTGPMAAKQFDGLAFTKIIVHRGIALEITQGDAYKVEVSAGENLINDISVSVAGDMLVLQDNTTCNWVRDYGQTTVYVTAPNLSEIYCKTEQEVKSNGVLAFPSLHVISEDSTDGYSDAGTGDIILEINNHDLHVECNNVSRFYITGRTSLLSVNFYEGGGIFYGQDFLAGDVHIFHRGSNDLFVHPLDAISGDIYNIGNVISYSHPPMVNVTQHYQGKLLFY